jgi:hypothetical protein
VDDLVILDVAMCYDCRGAQILTILFQIMIKMHDQNAMFDRITVIGDLELLCYT